MAHSLLLNHYRRRLQNVFEQLGSSTQQVPVSAEVHGAARPLSGASCALRDRRRVGAAFPLRASAAADCVHHDAAGSDAAVGLPLPADPALTPYTRAADLLSDLTVLRASLMENHGHRLAADADRSAADRGPHLRTASADARYTAACAGACRGGGGDLRLRREAHSGCVDLICLRRSRRRPAEVLDTFRAIAELKRHVCAGGDSAVRHQRSDQRGGCAACAVAGAAGRSARSRPTRQRRIQACSRFRCLSRSKTCRMLPPIMSPALDQRGLSAAAEDAGSTGRRSCWATPTRIKTAA